MSSDRFRCSTNSSTSTDMMSEPVECEIPTALVNQQKRGTNRVFGRWSYLDRHEEPSWQLVDMDVTWSQGGMLAEIGEFPCRDRYLYRCALNMDPMICGSDQISVAQGRKNDREESGSCWHLYWSKKIGLWEALEEETIETLMVLW